jgi:DNA-nicking Smr family endonuclease
MAARARHLTEADRADWAHVARQIAPLRGRARPPPQKDVLVETAPPERRSSPAPRPPSQAPMTRTPPPVVAIGAEPAGLDRATWQRFRGGKLVAARRLDLHGMTTQHAHRALITFLRSAHAEQIRCVEVITGRGSVEKGGTIRRELPMWLNLPDLRPIILAASHPHAANPGSVRILLRRAR